MDKKNHGNKKYINKLKKSKIYKEDDSMGKIIQIETERMKRRFKRKLTKEEILEAQRSLDYDDDEDLDFFISENNHSIDLKEM